MSWADRLIPLIERFENKVERIPEFTCWVWDGGRDQNGYGKIRDGLKRKYAHRVSYEIYRGPIPHGLTLDHLCRNRWCVNPAHLEPVSKAENVMRGFGAPANNARKMTCPRGHDYDRFGYGQRICTKCKSQLAKQTGVVK